MNDKSAFSTIEHYDRYSLVEGAAPAPGRPPGSGRRQRVVPHIPTRLSVDSEYGRAHGIHAVFSFQGSLLQRFGGPRLQQGRHPRLSRDHVVLVARIWERRS